MPSSPILTARVRDALLRQPGITEKRMFGGTAFMLYGNLLVAVWEDSLIARVGLDQATAALKKRHVGPMDVTGRPMKGWIMIAAAGLDEDRDLGQWIDQATHFVLTLPPKP